MRFMIVMASFLLFVWTGSILGQTKSEPPKTFDLSAIDAYIASYVKEKGLVGLSVAILRDGQTVFAKGYGLRQLEKSLPMESNTSFAIASITNSSLARAFSCWPKRGGSPCRIRSASTFRSSRGRAISRSSI